ncbi:hypothetical protein D3C78_1162160 [compost metagenome]
MTFGPRTMISPTVPRGTSLSFSSTMRSVTASAGRPTERTRPLATPSAVWFSGPLDEIGGATSVMP